MQMWSQKTRNRIKIYTFSDLFEEACSRVMTSCHLWCDRNKSTFSSQSVSELHRNQSQRKVHHHLFSLPSLRLFAIFAKIRNLGSLNPLWHHKGKIRDNTFPRDIFDQVVPFSKSIPKLNDEASVLTAECERFQSGCKQKAKYIVFWRAIRVPRRAEVRRKRKERRGGVWDLWRTRTTKMNCRTVLTVEENKCDTNDKVDC